MEDNKTNCASVEFDDSTENRNVATTSGNARDSKSGSVLISLRQKGNPVLKFIRSVPWQFDNIIPDYQFGPTSCALYLSLRYHNLNPDYIQERFKLLGNSYNLRVLLVLVDVKDPHHALKELGRICILTDCTLILAFSLEEAGRYLELYKSYENKPADLIMEKNETNYSAKLMDALTSLKKVNRSDALSLSSTFGSLTQIINATEENMSLCPGIGPLKAQKLHKVFHQPFSKNFKPGSK